MQLVKAMGFLKRSKSRMCGMALSLSLGAAVIIPLAAQAQFYGGGWRGYGPYGPYYGGYGGGGYDDPDDEEPGYPGPRYGYGGPANGSLPNGSAPNDRRPVQKDADIISLDVIQRKIQTAGFKLIAPPRHKGNIYLAEVEDSKSIRHRLVYDAHDGHLIENTSLGPVKKLKLQPDEPKESPKPDRSGDANAPYMRGAANS